MIEQQSAYLGLSPEIEINVSAQSNNAASTAALSTPEIRGSTGEPVSLTHMDGPEDMMSEKKLCGQKRKRKTEKQLACLQQELRGSNMLWSRQKIIEISERTGMSETQIYKWWWD